MAHTRTVRMCVDIQGAPAARHIRDWWRRREGAVPSWPLQLHCIPGVETNSVFKFHRLSLPLSRNSDAMEAAISRLQAAGEQEFLRTSATALRIIQNILSQPGEEKFWRVRKASRVRERERMGPGKEWGAEGDKSRAVWENFTPV